MTSPRKNSFSAVAFLGSEGVYCIAIATLYNDILILVLKTETNIDISLTMTIRAWYMDNDVEADQRAPHRIDDNHDVSLDVLESLGVLHWSGINGVEDPVLHQIRKERGYNYDDMVFVTPSKLPDYENKIKSFFKEHIHYDEEIRFCVDGSGYFDVRGRDDEWIRIFVESGDLIILPEGIYHRFTCDDKDYIQALRLFVGEPVWTPYNRDEIDEMKNASRQKYVNAFLK